MENTEVLREGRNRLLRLHKVLVDRERSLYESRNGPLSSGQFLSLLLEDQSFAWLRKFSALIVEIDEMFSQKDGYTDELVSAHLRKLRELLEMKDTDLEFTAKYRQVLDTDREAAGMHAKVLEIVGK